MRKSNLKVSGTSVVGEDDCKINVTQDTLDGKF